MSRVTDQIMHLIGICQVIKESFAAVAALNSVGVLLVPQRPPRVIVRKNRGCAHTLQEGPPPPPPPPPPPSD